MENQANKETLLAAYRVPGFRARAQIDSYEDNHAAFVITLDRRQKKRCAAYAGQPATVSMTSVGVGHATLAAADEKFIWTLICAA